jgi:hypothetical protein
MQIATPQSGALLNLKFEMADLQFAILVLITRSP